MSGRGHGWPMLTGSLPFDVPPGLELWESEDSVYVYRGGELVAEFSSKVSAGALRVGLALLAGGQQDSGIVPRRQPHRNGEDA